MGRTAAHASPGQHLRWSRVLEKVTPRTTHADSMSNFIFPTVQKGFCAPAMGGLLALMLGLSLGCRRAAPPPATVPTGPSPAESAAALEKLSRQAPVKIAWMDGPTVFFFDSTQPAPPRSLRQSPSQERPVFTPDGASVLVTDAGQIIALPLPAGPERLLAVGHALATVRDPESHTDWVYAATTPEGGNIFRFPLHAPDQPQPVWDAVPVDPRSTQVSRDGQRLATRFFGTDGGTGDINAKDWTSISASRPIALAPDASHLAAMLDGTGRRLRFFHPSGEPWDPQSDDLTPPARWQSALPESLWAGPDARYTDLRWSHHPQFLLLTESRSTGADRLALARLTPNASEVEALAVLAATGPGIRGADAWIGGSATASLAEWPASPPTYHPPSQLENGAHLAWPKSQEGVSFLWDTRLKTNHLADRPAPCRLTPRGSARFGEWGDLLLDGGTFEASLANAQAVATMAAATNTFVINILVTESFDAEGPLSIRLAALQLKDNRDAFSLSRVDQALVFRALLDPADGTPPREYQSMISPLAITAHRPFHLMVELKDGKVTWTIDGEQIGDPQTAGPPSLAGWKSEEVTRLVFGDNAMRTTTGWRGRLEKILILNRIISFDELRDNRANAAAATVRRPGSVLRVRATLREMPTLPPPATPGSPQLVQQLYDVKEVLSGQLKMNPLPVWHWAVLDGHPTASRPTEVGTTYDLKISTLARHRETEMEETHLGPAGLPIQGYLDVAPPQNPPTVSPVIAPRNETITQ